MIIKAIDTKHYYYDSPTRSTRQHYTLDILLGIAIVFFIVEFLYHLYVCLNKTRFMYSLINILDAVGLLSLALGIILNVTATVPVDGLMFLHVFAWNFWICRWFHLI